MISSSTFGEGDGGSVAVSAGNLTLLAGSLIGSDTGGGGDRAAVEEAGGYRYSSSM